MITYKSNKNIQFAIDLVGIVVSFFFAYLCRSVILGRFMGIIYGMDTYVMYLAVAMVLYVGLFFSRKHSNLASISRKELLYETTENQIVFIMLYCFVFFMWKQGTVVSRLYVAFFFVWSVFFCMLGRMVYRKYCLHQTDLLRQHRETFKDTTIDENVGSHGEHLQHVYLIGAKSIGQYGGYESFVRNLLWKHRGLTQIEYHVACKKNGDGSMNLSKLPGAQQVNDYEFTYGNAHGFMIEIPEKLGAAQAIYYDLKALAWVCNHIENNQIERPIVYILASRIGPFEKKYVKRIHAVGGKVFQNPDGHEDWRRKWNALVRRYWKFSEKHAVKNADLVVCDSKNIESYIQEEYANYRPKTTFIAYGASTRPSPLADDDPGFSGWLLEHNLRKGNYYVCIGRFVPENNHDIMIREFMASDSKKDLAIITTDNNNFARELEERLHYKADRRIKFVGTVYDKDLINKIRENAYGYLHGHEVGGTNPSLLEALGRTKLNLLYDVSFNREVAEDTALYWSKEEGALKDLINQADALPIETIEDMGARAKKRIEEEYSWEKICREYQDVFGVQ